MNNNELMGYRRANGRVGVRNYVAIIPVDDVSNATAEAVGRIIQGTLPLPHSYGSTQFGDDADLFFKTIIGTGCNPNMAAAVVIAIESEFARRVAEGIAETGKPVEAFGIEGHGELKTIEEASRTAGRLVQEASSITREPTGLSDLTMSVKCGESDTTNGLASNPTVGKVVERIINMGGTVLFGETSEITGGEQIVASRFKTEEGRRKFLDSFNEYLDFIAGEHVDLLGSQPSQGNIKGGISTIEEKGMGNIKKIGSAKIDGVVDLAESPSGKGLYFMPTSCAASEVLTLFAASGAVVNLFPTGQGNVAGNPVMPVIKLSGNPHTIKIMSEHIDLDVSGILSLEKTLDEAGEELFNLLTATINGRLTCEEILGHKEFAMTKLFRSA